MNLTLESPRSPREQMAGLAHLPRMIDKARAARQNTLGEYIYPCPMDNIMLEFLKVDPDTFQNQACNSTDEEISTWIGLQSRNVPSKDKEAANHKILNAQPDSPEKLKSFHELRDRIDPSRTDITTWADLIDLEEGRL